jgi:hypothetical protein
MLDAKLVWFDPKTAVNEKLTEEKPKKKKQKHVTLK